jgi:hypothetical protein
MATLIGKAETAKKTPTKKIALKNPPMDAYMRQRVADMREKSRFRARMYDLMIKNGHSPV